MECICWLLLYIDAMPLSNKVDQKLFLRAIAIFCSTIIFACTKSSQTKVEINGLVDIAVITQHIDRFMGKSVLIRNDIVETIGERGFLLDKDRVFGGKPILVINTAEITPIFPANSTPEVLVNGTVRRLNLIDLEQKYGLNLNPNLYAQYENQPVIVADSLIPSPDPEDLLRNPEFYEDKPLAIKGELEDITSYGLFELDEEKIFGGKDLLVVQPQPRIELDDEQNAIIYGTLHPFRIVDLTQNYDFGWDSLLQKQIEAEYTHKFILVADEILLLQ